MQLLQIYPPHVHMPHLPSAQAVGEALLNAIAMLAPQQTSGAYAPPYYQMGLHGSWSMDIPPLDFESPRHRWEEIDRSSEELR
ncbi:hypothetical protein AURDEDRAFT_165446 [Auricularia subglabra TFB-10046 SS5]|nr:hypothetical protein AURDEDRAFT_165446 [Auricularia subglabra TFB-10046 SS5]